MIINQIGAGGEGVEWLEVNVPHDYATAVKLSIGVSSQGNKDRNSLVDTTEGKCYIGNAPLPTGDIGKIPFGTINTVITTDTYEATKSYPPETKAMIQEIVLGLLETVQNLPTRFTFECIIGFSDKIDYWTTRYLASFNKPVKCEYNNGNLTVTNTPPDMGLSRDKYHKYWFSHFKITSIIE